RDASGRMSSAHSSGQVQEKGGPLVALCEVRVFFAVGTECYVPPCAWSRLIVVSGESNYNAVTARVPTDGIPRMACRSAIDRTAPSTRVLGQVWRHIPLTQVGHARMVTYPLSA